MQDLHGNVQGVGVSSNPGCKAENDKDT